MVWDWFCVVDVANQLTGFDKDGLKPALKLNKSKKTQWHAVEVFLLLWFVLALSFAEKLFNLLQVEQYVG